MSEANTRHMIEVVEQENKLLEVVRSLAYGEVLITIQNSEIVLIEERKKIKPKK